MMTETAKSPSQVFLGMTAIIVSEPMQRLMDLVQRVARSSATTLVTGESGVGKPKRNHAEALLSDYAAMPCLGTTVTVQRVGLLDLCS